MKEKFPWLISDEEREAMWARLEKRKKELRSHPHALREYALNCVKDNGGFIDKRLLYGEIGKYVLEKHLSEFTDETWDNNRVSVKDDAECFAYGLARGIVRWIAENTCIDLYDVIATKKGMERLQKFGTRVEAVRNGRDDTVKVWPKQWNDPRPAESAGVDEKQGEPQPNLS